MATSSSTEIQQLKELIENGFKDVDKKIEQVRDDIKGLDDRLRAIEINQAQAQGRMDEWKTAIQKIPDLAEKVGELKKRCIELCDVNDPAEVSSVYPAPCSGQARTKTLETVCLCNYCCGD